MHPKQQFYLLAGLGNPGSEYEMTRHNLGYLVVQAFARRMGWHFKNDRRFNALVAKGIIGEASVHLMQPLTYMNLSGIAIKRYLDFYKWPNSYLTVVTDDVALPFGKLRFRAMGSSGGHNGLKSVEAYLGTSHYSRLRMGVGHPGEKELAGYVLESFSPDELTGLETFIGHGIEILELQVLNR
ncbi:MAG: aminoacyl-tRNA hydrolase [Candidatus Protochlamydia sp.]|nr:aminoacyl-tRNA hydrolase [Candidatus Protochlamydia sp.]